jgi:hypothetical protein
VHRAGERLFVDYCGQTVQVVDARTGEVHEAQVFVAVWGASNYTYAEATWSQSLPDWIGAPVGRSFSQGDERSRAGQDVRYLKRRFGSEEKQAPKGRGVRGGIVLGPHVELGNQVPPA